jgi:hypothetical protein
MPTTGELHEHEDRLRMSMVASTGRGRQHGRGAASRGDGQRGLLGKRKMGSVVVI